MHENMCLPQIRQSNNATWFYFCKASHATTPLTSIGTVQCALDQSDLPVNREDLRLAFRQLSRRMVCNIAIDE